MSARVASPGLVYAQEELEGPWGRRGPGHHGNSPSPSSSRQGVEKAEEQKSY